MLDLAASGLKAESVMPPCPEPGSVLKSMPSVSYLSTTPAGALSARFPERVSTTVLEPDEMSELPVTCRPDASVPDIDQPLPSVSVVLTASLNVTVTSLSLVALADVIVGAGSEATGTVADSRSLPEPSRAFPGPSSYMIVTAPTGSFRSPLSVKRAVLEPDAAGFALTATPDGKSAPPSIQVAAAGVDV